MSPRGLGVFGAVGIFPVYVGSLSASSVLAKVLSLIQEWCDAFILKEGQMESVFKAYRELRRRKEPFPPRDETVRFQIKGTRGLLAVAVYFLNVTLVACLRMKVHNSAERPTAGAEESPALNPSLATTKHTTAETKAMVLSPAEIEALRRAVDELFSSPNLPRKTFEADYAEASAGKSRLRATIEQAFENGQEDSDQLSNLIALSDKLEEVLSRIQATGSATQNSSLFLSSSLKDWDKPSPAHPELSSSLPQVPEPPDILSGDPSEIPPPPPQGSAPDVATQIENDGILAMYFQEQEDRLKGADTAVPSSKHPGSVSNIPAHRIRLESYSSGPVEAADRSASANTHNAYTGLRQMVNGMLLARKTRTKEEGGHRSDDEIEEFLGSSPRENGADRSMVVPVSQDWSVVRDRSSGVKLSGICRSVYEGGKLLQNE
ncbi:hypothetical protein FOL47_001215 [Perkinsus chesapeaki]|uniref:VHS domain-containing protein n=1 Tax=Perkinsus chesapeaki TaxID=330153 RepID=A0A7J6MJK3_PERCH|nr:hypothetical protein FOL47_001215 [Perkinsus chesapeaki]